MKTVIIHLILIISIIPSTFGYTNFVTTDFGQPEEFFTALSDVEGILEERIGLLLKIIEQEIAQQREMLERNPIEERQTIEEDILDLEDMYSFYADLQRNVQNGNLTGQALRNPLNAFLFIHRLAADTALIRAILAKRDADGDAQSWHFLLPTQRDVLGAVEGVLRVQQVYKLDVNELLRAALAGGNRTHFLIGGPLDAHSCFLIATHALNNPKLHAVGHDWLNAALEREPCPELVSKIATLLEKAVSKETAALEGRVEEDEEEELNRLCRGESQRASELYREPSLYCYLKMDRPELLIAPLKVELLNQNPMLAMFRQVIQPSEVAAFKQISRDKLRRAKVFNSTGQLEIEDTRTCKILWMKEQLHPIVVQFNKRIESMTNFDLYTAEDLQIANYGIGGHFDAHYDHVLDNDTDPFGRLRGNRIATLLVYLTQPELGGMTAFPELGFALRATAGDAVFWYNLQRSGSTTMGILHAACPMAYGEKWVLNKWPHSGWQEFRRPCALAPNINERFVGDLGN